MASTIFRASEKPDSENLLDPSAVPIPLTSLVYAGSPEEKRSLPMVILYFSER